MAVLPVKTVVSMGSVRIVGNGLTINRAGLDVAVPESLVKTARNWLPWSVAKVGGAPLLTTDQPAPVAPNWLTAGVPLSAGTKLKLEMVWVETTPPVPPVNPR